MACEHRQHHHHNQQHHQQHHRLTAESGHRHQHQHQHRQQQQQQQPVVASAAASSYYQQKQHRTAHRTKYVSSSSSSATTSSSSASASSSSSSSKVLLTLTPTHLQFWHIIHVILFLIDITSSLTMTEVKIPNHIMRFKSALLGCRYSLDGESLYSVKWYKDGHEFYRYVPRDKPPGQAFPLPGVNIDLRNSSDTQVLLRRVTLQSTGLYRCEVSGEKPAFNTVSESETMTVVVTPNHGPKITGGQPRYQIGDLVRVNCTSAPSKPVCHLSWLINGEPANRSYLRQYDKVVFNRDGLEMARLGLEFRVRAQHFKHGDMKLKCIAKISSLYWQSNEESVESDRQQRAPALESRETVAAKSSTHGAAAASKHLHRTTHQLLLLLLGLLATTWLSIGGS